MGLKKLAKTETKKELTAREKEDLFNAIVRGEDYCEEIETSRGTFEVKFPRMRDLETIGRLVARRTGGLNIQSFDNDTYILMNETATLDTVILHGPAWYENAKKENDHFTWSEIPDIKFIQEIYSKVFRFRDEVQELFKLDKEDENTRMVADVDTNDSNEPNLFDGLSGSL